MWIRTIDGRWYVHGLRGVVFVTWVAEADRAQAAKFTNSNLNYWLYLLEDITGMQLQAVAADN